VPSKGRSDFLDTVVPPESTDATERWDSALCAQSCPGKDEDTVGGRDGGHDERL
jgi:hypothetical protein